MKIERRDIVKLKIDLDIDEEVTKGKLMIVTAVSNPLKKCMLDNSYVVDFEDLEWPSNIEVSAFLKKQEEKRIRSIAKE